MEGVHQHSWKAILAVRSGYGADTLPDRYYSVGRFRVSTTDEKWFFRNLGGRKWMKLSGEQGSKLF